MLQTNRRRYWICTVVVLAVGAAVYFAARPSRRFNVLLITLDTTRADRIGCYGYAAAATPSLDALARRGVLFERAYAPAPLTLPSHASMLTGLYPPEHGLHNNGQGALPAGLPTLATELRAAGYETGAFIAAVVLEKKFGLSHGFQNYDDDLSQADETQHGHHRYRAGKLVIDSALNWLRPRAGRPVFCWVHLFDPHFPYLPHTDRFGDQFADRPYDAELAYVDEELGRLFDSLERSGMLEQTIVVVAGDHGESLDEHGERAHSMTLYNSALEVPLLIAVPRESRPGLRVAEPVSLVDVCPTVLECIGRIPMPGISGRSLRPALHGEPISSTPCYAETDEPYDHAHWSPLRALIMPDWKYIRSPKAELYNLLQDRQELHNLAGEKPEIVQDMEDRLSAWERSMQKRMAENVVLTDQERRALNSLGYSARNQGGTEGERALPDVKDRLAYFNMLNDANAMMDAGRYDLAQPVLQKIVSADPKYFLAQGDLGRCLLRLKQTPQAIVHLRKNVELDPKADRVRAMLGAALFLNGEFPQAVEELQIALNSSPELYESRYNLGLALEKLNRNNEAVKQYQLCLEQQPQFAPARKRLELLLRRQPD